MVSNFYHWCDQLAWDELTTRSLLRDQFDAINCRAMNWPDTLVMYEGVAFLYFVSDSMWNFSSCLPRKAIIINTWQSSCMQLKGSIQKGIKCHQRRMLKKWQNANIRICLKTLIYIQSGSILAQYINYYVFHYFLKIKNLRKNHNTWQAYSNSMRSCIMKANTLMT